MKRFFLASLLLCLAAGSAQAEDYAYLAIEKTDGTVLTLDVAQLKITFSGGNLNVSNVKEQQSIALVQLRKMYFTNDAQASSALNEVVGDDTEREVMVFSLQGALVGKYANVESAQKSLPEGVYVVLDGQRTYKLDVQ